MKKSFLFIVAAVLIGGSAYSQKNTKEISQEVPAIKGGLVRVVSSSRKLEIKTWNQLKVKITAVIAYDSIGKTLTDDGWFEEMGITVKPFSNRVDILSRSTGVSVGYSINGTYNNTQRYYNADNVLVTKGQSGTGSKSGTTLAAKPFVQSLVVMIPEGTNLDLDEKYGDVYIGAAVGEASIEMNNGALDAQDVKSLKLKAQYCNANFGNIETAEVEFSNGTFRAQQITDLDLDSKNSSIEYTKGTTLYLRSQSDNVSVDELSKLDGRKAYGSLRIDKLNTSMEIEGNNMDIKLRNISPTVELVKIDNRYGDVRLPVRGLTNYAVNFTGPYSTVFSPFEKVAVKDETTDKDKDKVKEVPSDGAQTQIQKLNSVTINGQVATAYGNNSYSKYKTGVGVASAASNTPPKFTSAVGDVKGKHTKFEIVCPSCTVDFK